VCESVHERILGHARPVTNRCCVDLPAVLSGVRRTCGRGGAGYAARCCGDTAFIDGVVCVKLAGVPCWATVADTGDALCDACLAHPPLWGSWAGGACYTRRDGAPFCVLGAQAWRPSGHRQTRSRWMARVIAPFVTPRRWSYGAATLVAEAVETAVSTSRPCLAKAICPRAGASGGARLPLRRVRRTHRWMAKGGERFAHLDGAQSRAHLAAPTLMAGRPVLLWMTVCDGPLVRRCRRALGPVSAVAAVQSWHCDTGKSGQKIPSP